MKSLYYLAIFYAVFCFCVGRAEPAGPALPPSDCVLKGAGQVFTIDEQSGSFKKDEAASYALSAARIPIGVGSFLYVETKTFSNAPNQQTMFKQSRTTGTFNYSAPDGSIRTFGTCTRIGHCIGSITITAAKFTGRFVTDFDSKEIHTVTFAEDGSFVDEVLAADQCPSAN